MRITYLTWVMALLLSACENPDYREFEDVQSDTLRVHQLIQTCSQKGHLQLVPKSYHSYLGDMQDSELANNMPVSGYGPIYGKRIEGLRKYYLQQFYWRAVPSDETFLVLINSWPNTAQATQAFGAERIAFRGVAMTRKWEKEYDFLLVFCHERQVFKVLGDCGAECLRGPFEAIQHTFQADSVMFKPWEL